MSSFEIPPRTRYAVEQLQPQFAAAFTRIYDALYRALNVYSHIYHGEEPHPESSLKPLNAEIVFDEDGRPRIVNEKPLTCEQQAEWEEDQGGYLPGDEWLFREVDALHGETLSARQALQPVQVALTDAYNTSPSPFLPRIRNVAGSSAHELATALVEHINGICMVAQGIMSSSGQANLQLRWRRIHDQITGSKPFDASPIAIAMWTEAVRASAVTPISGTEDTSAWWTLKKATDTYVEETGYLTPKAAKSRLVRACESGDIPTVGEGPSKRLEPKSVAFFILSERINEKADDKGG